MNGTSHHSKNTALFRDEAIQDLHAAQEGRIVLAPRLSGTLARNPVSVRDICCAQRDKQN